MVNFYFFLRELKGLAQRAKSMQDAGDCLESKCMPPSPKRPGEGGGQPAWLNWVKAAITRKLARRF